MAGPDKDDHYTDVRADNNSRVCLNNNAAFTGANPQLTTLQRLHSTAYELHTQLRSVCIQCLQLVDEALMSNELSFGCCHRGGMQAFLSPGLTPHA